MRTILLVDDDSTLLGCLKEIFERSRYRVIARHAADEALTELAAGTHVDLVITDYRMHSMDGIEFLRRLRDVRPLVPAVMLTGHGTLDGYLKAKGLGAVEFIEKPVRSRDLLRTVEDVLADKRGHVDRSEAQSWELVMINAGKDR